MTVISIIAIIFVLVFLGVGVLRIKKINSTISTLKETAQVLSTNNNSLKRENESLSNSISKATSQLDQIKSETKICSDNFQQLKQQAEMSASSFHDMAMELAAMRLNEDLDVEQQKYLDAAESYKQDYLEIIEELVEEYNKMIAEKTQQINSFNEQLNELQTNVSVAVESKKIAEQNSLEQDFHKCVISDQDKIEISRLREIEPYFRNPRPICKIIWESYYKDSLSSLLARILPEKQAVSGIYKITNLANNKVYIGQSVNLSERLRNHVKAGVGIDAPNLKLYADMKKYGVENFMFEILEKCPPTKLNGKEEYWINFYHGQDFGYNMTKGGSKKIN